MARAILFSGLQSLKGSLVGESYALSEKVDHPALMRDFFWKFVGLPPGVIASEDSETLTSYPNSRKTVAEESLVRNFLSIQ